MGHTVSGKYTTQKSAFSGYFLYHLYLFSSFYRLYKPKMADLQMISTTTVQPASPNNSTHRIHLTPWDLSLLSVEYSQRGLLFLKPTSSPDGNNDLISRLKTSISLALDAFPPFAGCLVVVCNEDSTASFFVEYNGSSSGIEFVHAVSDTISVAHVLSSVYVPDIVFSFFPFNGVRSCEGINKSLFAVQVTELIDGIFVGCSWNHMLADGTTFWDFINIWSEISRNSYSNHTPNPLVLSGWFVGGVDPPLRLPFSYQEIISEKHILPPLQVRVFHFTKEKIAELKAKANAEMGTITISSLQALVGYIWRLVFRCRGNLKADQEIGCRVLVNMRQRLNPPLLEGCFGNVVHFGTATATVGELLEHGFSWAAWQINKMVGLQTAEEARKHLENWVRNPELATLSSLASNAIVIASSLRFNVYGNDFGWGRPIAARGGAGNNFDGKITVSPGVEEGSVDIEACLLYETLQAISNDPEFMEVVEV